MAVRPTMEYIITFVRDLILDPDGLQYTDQQVQDCLDMNRLDIYNEYLEPAKKLALDGTEEHTDFYSKRNFWEEGAVLQLYTGAVLTPATMEYQIGRWTFSTHQTLLPISVTGRVYNVYGVASKLLIQWENTIRGQFNFTADGLTIQRISELKDIHSLALTYQSMAWSAMSSQIKLVRKDIRG